MHYEYLTPEIATVLLGLVALVVGLVMPQRGKKAVGALAITGLAIILVNIILNFSHQVILFGGVYQIDTYASFFKVLFLTAALLILFMAGRYTEFFGRRRSEWYSFMIFATVGMMIMVSSGDLLTLYVGLELMTISFYIMSGYLLNDGLSVEAGIKYLIMGALSSAVLLFGMSLIYAASGSTIFTEIYQALHGGANQPVLIAGIVMLIAGLGFKVSAVPFHMWTPDIYQGAPTPVTAYLSVASKAAGFAALVRIFMVAFPAAQFNWHLTLAILAALTIVIGNLVALVQTNVKRLLAYSSIAQAGYILVGLAAANTYGIKGLLFYAMLYVFSNVGAFTVTTMVETESRSTDLAAFNGLGRRSPMLAAAMTVSLLSLAGIPPLAGFAGKFYLFSGAIQAGYYWLAFLGLLMSMVSVYYYLNVAKAMYIGPNDNETAIAVPAAGRLALWICLLGTIFIGIYPGPLSQLAQQSIALFFR